ncbi:MAG: outer membrane protein assembly factor BamB family protein [Ktedonobacterales bacterium]
MPKQNALLRPIRALSRKRWLALVLTTICLLGLGIYSWIGLLPHASHATPSGDHATASNTLLLFEETTESTTIHITARSTHDGHVVWTKSQAYTHDDYVRRGNGLQYVVDGEVVYYISKCRLFAARAGDGQTIWERDFSQPDQTLCLPMRLLLDSAFDRLYVVGAVSYEALRELPVGPGEPPMVVLPSMSEPRLLAFQASTGHPLWQNTSIGSVIDGLVFTADFVADGGILYTTQYPIPRTPADRQLIALNGQDGTVLWHDRRLTEETMSLTAANGVVYTLTAQLSADREHINGFTLAAFKGGQGTLLWSHPVHTDVHSPLIVTGTNLWLQSFFQTATQGTYHVQLHGYNLETGQDTIVTDLGLVQNHIPPAPTIVAGDSAVYLALGGTEVRAIRAPGGTTRWDTTGLENIAGLTVTDEFVIFITRNKARESLLVALDTKDGRMAWQQPLG